MSEYAYNVISDSQGEFQPPVNPLSQITEEQVKQNFCFIVAPGDEVIFFKTQAMWAEAKKILEGYQYKVFYCHEMLRLARLKNVPK